MIRKLQALTAWAVEQFLCIYGCGYGGTYWDVQNHQASCPNR